MHLMFSNQTIFSCEINTPNCLNEWLNLNEYLTSKAIWNSLEAERKGFIFPAKRPLDRFGIAVTKCPAAGYGLK